MSPKVSLVWCSDSSEESSRRGDPSRAEAETAGFRDIRLEASAGPGRPVWLERLLNMPLVLDTRRRISQLLPKE